MMTLRMEGLLPGGGALLGPAPWFQVSGNHIRQGPHAGIVARYAKHTWEVGDHHFTSIGCKERTILHFEDTEHGPAPPFGPFDEVRFIDGTFYADGELLAKFQEESQLWHCYPTENYWPILKLEAARGVGD
jgi:hypothetical protein